MKTSDPNYPRPTNGSVTLVMRGNRKTDTGPELRLRSALHRKGMRFRKQYLVRAEGLGVRCDLAFPSRKLAVFIDGCFWHGCPQHGKAPTSNVHYWNPKIAGNIARDRRVDNSLRNLGWTVLRLWEHSPIEDSVQSVAEALAAVANVRSVEPSATHGAGRTL